jgi:hypothetical protein
LTDALCSGIQLKPLRALSSAGEHCLHTAGVTGSIPVAPTMKSRAGSSIRPFILQSIRVFMLLLNQV